MGQRLAHFVSLAVLAAVSCAPRHERLQEAAIERPAVQPGHQRIIIASKMTNPTGFYLTEPVIIHVERPDHNPADSQMFTAFVAANPGATLVNAPAVSNSDAEIIIEDESSAIASGTRPKGRTNRVLASAHGTSLLIQGGAGVQRVLAWDLKPGAAPVDVWLLDKNGVPDPATKITLDNSELAEHLPGAKSLTKRKYKSNEPGPVTDLLKRLEGQAAKAGFKFPKPQ